MINNFEILKRDNYAIKVTSYIPEGKVESVLVTCHGFSGNRNGDTIKMFADGLNKMQIAVVSL